MSITKTLRASTLAASLAIALGMAFTPAPAVADTVTGNTVFKIILQPTTVLYYYSEIDLTIPSAALATLAGSGSAKLVATTVTGSAPTSSTVTADAKISPTAPSLSNVALTLSNAWGVYSITSPGNTTTVSVAFAGTTPNAATLTGGTAGSGTIDLSNPGTSVKPFSGTGFGSAQVGDVTMNMDLSKAAAADTYAGASIVITATST